MLLFIEPANIGSTIRIEGEDARHAFALRPDIGDEVTVSDGKAFFYPGNIQAIDKKGITIEIMRQNPIVPKPYRIHLLAGLLKGDKNEFVIQKAVELGADRITFFLSQNCIAQLPDLEKKYKRFATTAKLAAMQCGSLTIPQIAFLPDFQEVVRLLREQNGMLFYEHATEKLSSFLKRQAPGNETAFAIGPEGGFSAGEIQKANDANIPLLSLGSRILRAETAPICAISVLLSYYGEL